MRGALLAVEQFGKMRPPSVTLAPTARVASASSASTAAVASRALAIRSEGVGRVAASGMKRSSFGRFTHCNTI